MISSKHLKIPVAQKILLVGFQCPICKIYFIKKNLFSLLRNLHYFTAKMEHSILGWVIFYRSKHRFVLYD